MRASSGVSVRARTSAAASLLREDGGIRLGRRVAESWRKHRFQAPYLRDSLMDAGLLVETLETAATWSALPTVYDAVRSALRESLSRDGRRPLIMSHVSHGYATGAFGKWHQTPPWEQTAAGPFDHWPTREGFDTF